MKNKNSLEIVIRECLVRIMILIGVFIVIVNVFGGWDVYAASSDEHKTNQGKAHQIAELARELGLPEDDQIILRAKEIWHAEDSLRQEALQAEEYERLHSGIINYYDPETEAQAIKLAKTVKVEARGIWSITEQACIIWTCLNRVDNAKFPNTIDGNLVYGQMAYKANVSTVDDYGRDIVPLARDVIYRWKLEKSGIEDVGRVLPKDYLWYAGNGQHNFFRNKYRGGTRWNYSLPSPYEN